MNPENYVDGETADRAAILALFGIVVVADIVAALIALGVVWWFL